MTLSLLRTGGLGRIKIKEIIMMQINSLKKWWHGRRKGKNMEKKYLTTAWNMDGHNYRKKLSHFIGHHLCTFPDVNTYLQHNPQYFYLVCYAVSADCKGQRTVDFPISFFQTGRQWNYDLQTLQDYSCPWSFVTVDHNRTDWGQVNLPCSNVTAVHLGTQKMFLKNLVKTLWIHFFLS